MASFAAMARADIMRREVLLGITGKDFTILAASKAAVRGASILKTSDDKTRELNKHTLMAYSGEAGDTGMRTQRVILSVIRAMGN